MVYEETLPTLLTKPYLVNPVALLQYMASDSAELHFTGGALAEGEDNFVIQVRMNGKWIDTYIGKNTGLLNRIVEERVDPDPLIGSGPEHYQDITIFTKYQRVSGFLLPASLEEVSTRSSLSERKILIWTGINQPISPNTFRPEPLRPK